MKLPEVWVHALTHLIHSYLLCNWFVLLANHNIINLCDQEGESGGKVLSFEAPAAVKSPVPVVKVKATSLMSSLMISKSTKQLLN